MIAAICLPKLNNLTPTLPSTLLKAMEEAGELARAVLKFLPCQNKTAEADELLADVASELLDVAQTCVTMIFVMEDCYGIKADDLIGVHLAKLDAKGYSFDHRRNYRISTTGNYKYLELPQLAIEDVTLLTTVCKIQEELGELTQFLGKKAGASGERREIDDNKVYTGCALELLDVAQCCFTMMYILAESYNVDIDKLILQHVTKLKRKGYCA